MLKELAMGVHNEEGVHKVDEKKQDEAFQIPAKNKSVEGLLASFFTCSKGNLSTRFLGSSRNFHDCYFTVNAFGEKHTKHPVLSKNAYLFSAYEEPIYVSRKSEDIMVDLIMESQKSPKELVKAIKKYGLERFSFAFRDIFNLVVMIKLDGGFTDTPRPFTLVVTMKQDQPRKSLSHFNKNIKEPASFLDQNQPVLLKEKARVDRLVAFEKTLENPNTMREGFAILYPEDLQTYDKQSQLTELDPNVVKTLRGENRYVHMIGLAAENVLFTTPNKLFESPKDKDALLAVVFNSEFEGTDIQRVFKITGDYDKRFTEKTINEEFKKYISNYHNRTLHQGLNLVNFLTSPNVVKNLGDRGIKIEEASSVSGVLKEARIFYPYGTKPYNGSDEN